MLFHLFLEKKRVRLNILRMNRRIIIVDDTCKSSAGGTALTIQALLEGVNQQVALIETRELNEKVLLSTNLDDVWVFGNITALSQESISVICAIMMTRTFFKIEFDYGFCKYRSEYGYKYFTGNDKWEPASNPENYDLLKIYSLIHERAKAVFYMSNAQMLMHMDKLSTLIKLNKDKLSVLGSSFRVEDLFNMVSIGNGRKVPDNCNYAIIDGAGGFHSDAKGVREAVLFAKNNKLNFSIVSGGQYSKFIQKLSEMDGLIFLPNVHDTCPRVTIEAKIMGLNLITNDNSQHITEEWFNQEPMKIANYIMNQQSIFKNIILGE